MSTLNTMQGILQAKAVPAKFKLLTTQLLYILVIPFFFLCFVAIYKPFDLESILSKGSVSFTFNIVMIMCILLVVMIVSRLTVYFTGLLKGAMHSMGWYRTWCAFEVVASAFFVAMYVQLIMDTGYPYLEVMVRSTYYLALILFIPYIVIDLAISLSSAKDKTDMPADQSDSKLRFYDTRHTLKFVVSADMVLFIRSDENYIVINYLDGDKAKEYELRSSMKSVEEMCLENNILRCHRSYFINPQHIKALRKERENVILAELDIPALAPIPVSKRYYEDIAASL